MAALSVASSRITSPARSMSHTASAVPWRSANRRKAVTSARSVTTAMSCAPGLRHSRKNAPARVPLLLSTTAKRVMVHDTRRHATSAEGMAPSGQHGISRDEARNAMKFTGTITVEAPREALFARLRDAPFFASCVEGVRELQKIDCHQYTAVLETSVAYLKFRFDVAVTLVSADEPREIK